MADPAPGPHLAPGPDTVDALALRLDGFEGPLDLLLNLARTQKVDLARISMPALVDQFLAVLEGARHIRLELAADWLVMAAWLTWLKSRLLLPPDAPEAEEAEVAAENLAVRLAELAAMRAAAAALEARPQLGRDVFANGAPEDRRDIDRSRLLLDLPSLVRAYLTAVRRGSGAMRYRVTDLAFWTVQDALARLASIVGRLPAEAGWLDLRHILPEAAADSIQLRAALASALLAGLEMARDGTIRLRQEAAFGPILLAAAQAPHA